MFVPYIDRHQIDEVKALARLKRAERIKHQFEQRYGSEVRMYGSVYEAKRRQERYSDWIARGKRPLPIDVFGLVQTTLLEKLFNLQDGKCYICMHDFSEQRPATREHVTPKCRGGKNHHNILPACRKCNNEKDDREPYSEELKFLAFINSHRLHHRQHRVMNDQAFGGLIIVRIATVLLIMGASGFDKPPDAVTNPHLINANENEPMVSLAQAA